MTRSRLLGSLLCVWSLISLGGLGMVCLAQPAAPAKKVQDRTLSSPAFTPGATADGKRWALIIGIDYNEADKHLRPLKNAEKDAEAVYKLLHTHYGYQADKTIKLLSGARATREAIRDHL